MDAATRDEGIKKIRALIEKIEFCMLTTADDEGRLHSRPMAASEPGEFDGAVWFFTYGRSLKGQEIKQNRQVNASFADPGKQRYVSFSGSSEIVRDRAEIQRRWKPMYQAWFPKGLEEPDIALLKVTVEQAEYWDAPSSAISHVIALVQTQILGQKPNLGENRSVSLH